MSKQSLMERIAAFKKTLMVLAAAYALFFTPSGFAANRSTTTAASHGHAGDFGIGVMLGDPTGLNAKYWMSGTNALNFGLAYSFNDYVELLVDYTWAFPGAFGSGTGAQFVPYLGIGAALFVDTHNGYYYDNRGRLVSRYRYFDGYADSSLALGARIPLGLEFMPRGAPLGVFVELAPGVGVFPGVFAFFQGVLGARFYL